MVDVCDKAVAQCRELDSEDRVADLSRHVARSLTRRPSYHRSLTRYRCSYTFEDCLNVNQIGFQARMTRVMHRSAYQSLVVRVPQRCSAVSGTDCYETGSCRVQMFVPRHSGHVSGVPAKHCLRYCSVFVGIALH